MELDGNVDVDMMDEDTTEDTMMELPYESTDSDDESTESDDGGTESDSDDLLTPNGVSYESLQSLLMASQRATVMSGLKPIKDSTGKAITSKLLPEIIGAFRVFDTLEDKDIQDCVGCILISFSAGTRKQGRAIISAGAIPMMMERLQNRVDWMGPQTTEIRLVWCIMNLALSGEEFRKVLLAHGLNDILTEIVDKVPASHLLLISIAALSALEVEIPWELKCKRLPDVLRYIQWPNNDTELDDACRSLDYFLKSLLRQQLSIPKSVMDRVPLLIQYLTHSNCYVRLSSNDVLNTIASGSDEESQVLLDSNILNVAAKFLNDSSKCARACTMISKFTAGNVQQIACVMEKEIMTKLIHILGNFDGDLKTWRNASLAVANALDGRRSPEQFRSLVLHGTIEPLCKMLAIHSNCFASHGDEGHLKIKTTQRLLRCLDQTSIHLSSFQGPDFVIVRNLIDMIEEIFTRQGYRNYQRESKNDRSSDFDPALEQMLTLAMKQFSLDTESETLIKKMNTVEIKENVAHSPFHHKFSRGH